MPLDKKDIFSKRTYRLEERDKITLDFYLNIIKLTLQANKIKKRKKKDKKIMVGLRTVRVYLLTSCRYWFFSPLTQVFPLVVKIFYNFKKT